MFATRNGNETVFPSGGGKTRGRKVGRGPKGKDRDEGDGTLQKKKKSVLGLQEKKI